MLLLRSLLVALPLCISVHPPSVETAATASAAVRVATRNRLGTISPQYNSWNIDASPNRGFLWRNLSSPNLLQLAKGLPGGHLRFGGSGNDALWYGDGIGSNSCAGAAPRNFHCLNATMLDGLLALAEAASARLVFGLNIANVGCPEDASRHACLNTSGRQWGPGVLAWNATNAEGLIRHLAAKGQALYAFELGNEENGHWPGLGLSPAQEAQSFAQLAAIVADVYPNVATRPKIVGPDGDYQDSNRTQRLRYKGWEEAFLGNLSTSKVPLHAATLHEYIQVGWNGSSWTSLDPDVLDQTGIRADDFRDAVRATSHRVGLLPEPEIWAGEIGPHNGGSPPCNRSSMRWANFANSFWYMDAMALKAARGFSVFCRQDFVGADYGLLDCATQTPLPDYYVSRMWTQLMGTAVLEATVTGPRTVRAYAHCAAGAPRDLVILLLNLDNRPVNVDIAAGSGSDSDTSGHHLREAAPSKVAVGSRTEWHFTAGADGLGGTSIRLGGAELVWAVGQPLPPMPGIVETAATPVQVAPQSIVFVRVQSAAPAGLCV